MLRLRFMQRAVIPTLLCAVAVLPLAGATPSQNATADSSAGTVTRLLDECRTLTLVGRWDEALRRLEAERGRAGGPRERAAVSVEIARVLADRSFFHRRDSKAARLALERARAEVTAAGSADLAADAVQLGGQLDYADAFTSQDWETPRKAFQEAARVRERSKDLRGLAQSTFYLGLTYEQSGQPEPALALYTKALEIAEKAGDAVQQSYPHRHIGGILEEKGKLDDAERHIARCLALRREGGFRVGVPFALLQMADFVAAHGKDPARVERLREEAVREAEASGSTNALSAAHLALAVSSLEAGRKPDARAHAEKARAAAEAYGAPASVKAAQELLGKI